MNSRLKNMRKFFMKLSKPQDSFDYVVTDTNTAATIRYLGDKEAVSVPQQIDGNHITEIIPFTFSDMSDITDVSIPNGVESIE